MTDRSTPPRPPRIPWFKAGEYVSKSSGRPYLVAFLGGAKVILIPDAAAEPHMKGSVQTWNAYLEPAPPKPR
jgi:hypothetical protein